MLSDHQRRRIWEGWLGAEIRAHYSADLCQHYQRVQRGLTWTTLVASSSAALTLIADALPAGAAWLRPGLAIVAAAASLWSLVAHYQRRATDCADLHFRWARLAHAYESLWSDQHSATAPAQLDALRDREAELSKSGTTVLPMDRPRLLHWQEHVERHHGVARAS